MLIKKSQAHASLSAIIQDNEQPKNNDEDLRLRYTFRKTIAGNAAVVQLNSAINSVHGPNEANNASNSPSCETLPKFHIDHIEVQIQEEISE